MKDIVNGVIEFANSMQTDETKMLISDMVKYLKRVTN